MRARRATSVIVALLALTAATVGLTERPRQPGDGSGRDALEALRVYVSPPHLTPRISYIEVELSEGAHDRELQARRAGAVFVGTVSGIDRIARRYRSTWTVFDVDVEEVVKGDVGGKLQIIQWGGYEPRLYLWTFVTGDSLIRVDRTYLFIASTNPGGLPEDEGLWFMPHNIGHTQITDDNTRE